MKKVKVKVNRCMNEKKNEFFGFEPESKWKQPFNCSLSANDPKNVLYRFDLNGKQILVTFLFCQNLKYYDWHFLYSSFKRVHCTLSSQKNQSYGITNMD